MCTAVSACTLKHSSAVPVCITANVRFAQTAPSGLSRAQQLLAFQAVALPAMPAFNASQGGVVSRKQSLSGNCLMWMVVCGAGAFLQSYVLPGVGVLWHAGALLHSESQKSGETAGDS